LIGIREYTVDEPFISNETISFPILALIFCTKLIAQSRRSLPFCAPAHIGFFQISFESSHRIDRSVDDQWGYGAGIGKVRSSGTSLCNQK
jgi:hypothetical protein